MTKKISVISCSILILITNFLMITVFNYGEETASNIFVIIITALIYPGFLWAKKEEKAHLIRIESCALLLMATLSIMRLINRIDTLPDVVNGTVVVIAVGMGTFILFIAIFRILKKNDRNDKK